MCKAQINKYNYNKIHSIKYNKSEDQPLNIDTIQLHETSERKEKYNRKKFHRTFQIKELIHNKATKINLKIKLNMEAQSNILSLRKHKKIDT